MNQFRIKISIITPSFNSERTIEKTINSVLNQSYSQIEYIIVDGASTDRTLEIINKYRNHISTIISEPDKGIADAYNKGIRIATGTLIGIVAADDELLPNAIDRLVNKYDNFSDIIAGGVVMRDQHKRYRFYESNPDLSKLELCTSLCHPATYIRKSAYVKYGNYSLEYKCAMDRELLLRFYKEGASFQIIDEYLSLFNFGGISSIQPYKIAYLEDMKISIKYKISRLKTYSFYIKRIIKYSIRHSIRTVLEFINLWELVVKLLPNVRYISEKEFRCYIQKLSTSEC